MKDRVENERRNRYGEGAKSQDDNRYKRLFCDHTKEGLGRGHQWTTN